MNVFTGKGLLKVIMLVMLAFASCKPAEKSSLVLYSEEPNISVSVSSSCKVSSVSPLQNEADLKDRIYKSSHESLVKLKLKASNSLRKANYKISRTELMITERCGGNAVNGRPFIGLQQILVLENTGSRQLIEFKADTVIADQQSLSKPNILAARKIELEPYISGLTEKNYLQVKAYFKK